MIVHDPEKRSIDSYLTRARASVNSHKQFPHDFMVDTGGIRLAVRDYGGPGRDVLFLHGGPGPNLGSWDQFTQRLSRHFRCVAYDHRGHGHSDHCEDYTYSALVADVRSVIQQVGLQRPILVGHSWGGMIALMFAASFPGEISGLIAVDGIIPPHYEPMSDEAWAWLESQFRTDEVIAKLLAFEGTTEQFERLITWAKSHPDSVADQFSEDVVRRNFRQSPDGRWKSTQSADHLMALNRCVEDQELPGLDIYRRITDRVLLVMASDGKFSPSDVEQTTTIAPATQAVWIDGGHVLQDDAPELLEKVIREFARR